MSEPTPTGRSTATPSAEESGAAETTLRTYRYLRLCMIAVILALAISVLLEWADSSGCWQRSISAYYHTPTRAIFVSALVALGVGMIALLGNTTTEDAALNLGGLLAPIVAFVPTSDGNTCGVVPLEGSEQARSQAGAVVAAARPAIDNNMTALLCVVGVGLVFALVVLPRIPRESQVVGRPRGRRLQYLVGMWAAGLFSAVAVATFWFRREEFYAKAHFTAAILMFVCITIAVFANAYDRRAERAHPGGARDRFSRWLRNVWRSFDDLYGLLALSMVLAAAGIIGIGKGIYDWDHWVIAVEAALIALFALFWVLQTAELWHKGYREPALPIRLGWRIRHARDQPPA